MRLNRFTFSAVLRVCTCSAVLALTVLGSDALAQSSAPKSDSSSSLWNQPVASDGSTYAELVVKREEQRDLEPALLPLPAPILIAGLGLAVVIVGRRSFRR